jgi:predicted GNAT family N-acyltransferase
MTDLQFELCPLDVLPIDVADLIYTQLYKNWQVTPEQNWLEAEQGGRWIIARETGGTLAGVLRLMPLDDEDSTRLQIRQVVVNPELRGHGLGRTLMEQAEAIALAEGVTEFWLKARQPAWGFYEALGYEHLSTVYLSELTKIPHRSMRKYLA